ncbi:MAG: hypothetical protein HYX67_09975 [Candidatus Melainabacteria bacterium]|nr:hypothetical protein [Candidatus Melainabacteria bacterium]
MSNIVLRDPNNGNIVMASFNNIKVNASGTYLTADPISAVGNTVKLVAGIAYNLLISDANAATVSTMTISSIGGPAQIANGFLNGLVIGNALPPASTSAGRQGILFSDGAGSPWIGAVDLNGNIQMQTGGTPAAPNGVATLVANSATGLKGTFGVGTTAPSSAYGLDVRGIINSSYSSGGVGGGIALTNPSKTNAYNAPTPQNMTWSIVNSTSPSNGLQFQTLDVNGSSGNSPLMVLTDTGYLGIGTPSPDSKLAVDTSSSGEVGIRLRNTNTGSSAFSIYRQSSDTGNFVMFTNSSTRTADGGAGNTTLRTDSGTLFLGAGGGQNVTLLPSGNVGIGTTTPSTALQVNGTITASAIAGLPNSLPNANGGNGYQTLPGGLILQFGYAPSPGSGSTSITFPIAFPNYVYNFTAVPTYPNSPQGPVVIYSLSLTGATFDSDSNGPKVAVYWMAIGK